MKEWTLYTNCKLVKGYGRDLILDLEREQYHIIPRTLSDYLEGGFKGMELDEESLAVLEEYGAFLDEHELAFLPEMWGQLSPAAGPEDSEPGPVLSPVNQCTLKIGLAFDIDQLNGIAQYLDDLFCQSLLLIIDPQVSFGDVAAILSCFATSRLRAIELIASYDQWQDDHTGILDGEPRITRLILYGAPAFMVKTIGVFEQVEHIGLPLSPDLLFTKKVSPQDLVVNFECYRDARHKNAFYFKKLILDDGGNIYPDLDFTATVSNISTTPDPDLVFAGEAFAYYHVSKDHIDVCRDCEFRFCCPDQQIPLQRGDGSWYPAMECQYNPYLCKWKGEDGYQPLNNCGVTCNEHAFLIDQEKLDAANRDLWEE